MNSEINWPFIWFFSGVQLFSSAVQPRALLKCLQFLYPQNQNLWEQKPGIHIFTKLPRWLWCSPLIKNTMCFLYSKTHFLNYIARNFKLMLTVFLWSPPQLCYSTSILFIFLNKSLCIEPLLYDRYCVEWFAWIFSFTAQLLYEVKFFIAIW